MSGDATYGIDIVGNNKVERGARAAEQRLGKIPKHVGVGSRKFERESSQSLRRHSRSILRTFGEVEQAGSRIFGGRSITSGITSRLGGVTMAARAAGTGLGEAAASGGMLSGALGVVGVAAGATIGILAAAAYGAFKLADGWAKGAASIGRTAETIGISTKALQEFSAAAERAGVDKDKAVGTLGGLSQTLNDAKYGRNGAAASVLARMGVQMKTKADGTVDVEAMLPAIADGLKRQNSSGRRTAAQHLGIGLDALPAFTQGGKALSADMSDADKHAVVLSDAEIATGKRIARKSVMVGQLLERGADRFKNGLQDSLGAERKYDAVLAGGQAIADGANDFHGTVDRLFRPAAEKFDRAVDRIGAVLNGAGGGAGRLSARGVQDKARQGARLVPKLMALGLSRDDAIGMAANAAMESGANPRAREKSGNGVGLFQITDRARKALFRKVTGVDVAKANEDQQLQYQVWELRNSEARNWRRAHANGSDAASVADGYARHVERPANKDRDGQERAAVAGAMSIQLHVSGLPQGAKVEARGPGRKPAISHAYQPVRGG